MALAGDEGDLNDEPPPCVMRTNQESGGFRIMQLQPLFHVLGTAVIERLGKVQGGERLKVEYRGETAPDSAVGGKAHGNDWVLVGPLGPGETNAVHEITTADKEHLVVELHGYAMSRNGDGMEIRSAGIIRTAAPRFSEINGRVALVIERLGSDKKIEVTAYQF
jgi:hypothetical protein